MSNISLQGIGPFFEMRFGYYTHRNNTNIEEMDLEWTGDRTLRKWYCNRDMGMVGVSGQKYFNFKNLPFSHSQQEIVLYLGISIAFCRFLGDFWLHFSFKTLTTWSCDFVSL
jgi:hypothetical protein